MALSNASSVISAPRFVFSWPAKNVARLVVREPHGGQLLGGHAGSGQQVACQRHVELLGRAELGRVTTHALRNESLGRHALPLEDLRDERVAIDGGRDRLPYLDVVHRRLVDAEHDPEDRQRRGLDQLLLHLRVSGDGRGLRGLNVDRVQLAVPVLGQPHRPVVDDHEGDRREPRLVAPVMLVGDRRDVIVGDHLGDVKRPVGDQRVWRCRPLVRVLLDEVRPDRRAGRHCRDPDERGIGARQRDPKREVVDCFQPKRPERGVDAGRIALRVQHRHLIAVLDCAREERRVRRGKPRIDEALPRVDEVLRFDRDAVRVLPVLAQVKRVHGSVARDVVCLCGRRRHAAEVRRGFQKGLRYGSQDRGLVGELGLSRVERGRLIVEQHPQGLIFRQPRALRQRRGVAGRHDSRDEQPQRYGAPQPGAWDHRFIISG